MTWEVKLEKKKRHLSVLLSFLPFIEVALQLLFSSLYFDFSAKKTGNQLYWKGEEKKKDQDGRLGGFPETKEHE